MVLGVPILKHILFWSLEGAVSVVSCSVLNYVISCILLV